MSVRFDHFEYIYYKICKTTNLSMLISKTPYRIPLAGGGSDLPFYYKNKGGEFISCSIDQYVYVFLVNRKIHKNNLIQTTDVEFTRKINQIKNKIIKGALNYFNIKNYIHIGTFSTLPTKTGLGSSSSILVGLINLLYKSKKIKANKYLLYKKSHKIERGILKLSGGHQDQIMAAYGSIQKVKINKQGNLKISEIKISNYVKKKLENKLLLVFTSETRSSEKIIKRQEKIPKKKIIESYDKIKSLVSVTEKALKGGNFKELGKIFNTHWQIKKNISNFMSNTKLNKLYSKLMKNKFFIGGKNIGAGAGGFFLMVTNNKLKAIKYLKKNNIEYLEFKIHKNGSEIIQ